MRLRLATPTLFVAPGLTAAVLLVLLPACSGGGGSSTPVTIPAAPTGVTATPDNGKVQLAWSAVPGAASYNVYWAGTAGVTPASGTGVTGATSPYTLTGMTNGTPCYMVVTAVNSAGESPASDQVNATPFITPPASLAAAPGNAQVTLTWPAVTGATSYNAYWSGTTGVTKANGTKLTGVVSPYSHTGLTNGLGYYYVVTALDAAGESAESHQATAVPAIVPVPAAPSGLAAVVGNQNVNLTWNAVSGATDYNIYRGTASGALSTKTKLPASPVATASFNDTTVVNATMYYYQVTAANSTGESAGSNEVVAPVINLTGSTWSFSVHVLTNSCGSDIGTVTTFNATVNQGAGTTTFSGTMTNGGTFSGSVNGQNVTMTGSVPYTASGYAGTLNYQATATWSNTATAITLSGTANYQFVYAGLTRCTGTMSLTGRSN